MFQKTVLVVDDAPSIRAAMRIALEHNGFRVVEAQDGRAALEMARRHVPDLVLLDLLMPVLDGFQTARALARDFRTETIPLIAITALDEVDEAELARAGFCAHLRKPFTVGQLLGEMSRCSDGGAAHGADAGWAGAAQLSPRAA